MGIIVIGTMWSGSVSEGYSFLFYVVGSTLIRDGEIFKGMARCVSRGAGLVMEQDGNRIIVSIRFTFIFYGKPEALIGHWDPQLISGIFCYGLVFWLLCGRIYVA